MSNVTTAVGIIAFIVVMGLIVTAYPAVFGSLHEDAVSSGVVNKSGSNLTLQQGENVAQGFMGFTEAQVYFALILLIIVAWLIIYSL